MEVRTLAPHLALTIVHKVNVIYCIVLKDVNLLKNSRSVTKDDWSEFA